MTLGPFVRIQVQQRPIYLLRLLSRMLVARHSHQNGAMNCLRA